MEQTLHLGMKPCKQYSKFKEIINRVNDAAINKKSIERFYHTMSRKRESKRKRDDVYAKKWENKKKATSGYPHQEAGKDESETAYGDESFHRRLRP